MQQTPQALRPQRGQRVLDAHGGPQAVHFLRGIRPGDAIPAGIVRPVVQEFNVPVMSRWRLLPVVDGKIPLRRKRRGTPRTSSPNRTGHVPGFRRPGLGSVAEEAIVITARPEPTPISAPANSLPDRLLTPQALRFLARLSEAFEPRRRRLLDARRARQRALDAGELPEFPAETAEIRESPWQVAPPPADLLDRRVEITGPAGRKMIINALNS